MPSKKKKNRSKFNFCEVKLNDELQKAYYLGPSNTFKFRPVRENRNQTNEIGLTGPVSHDHQAGFANTKFGFFFQS